MEAIGRRFRSEAAPTNDFGIGSYEMPMSDFVAWVLEDTSRSSAVIRRVDLIKCTQKRRAYHEALMLHVFGDLSMAESKRHDTTLPPGASPCSYRVILERAGTLPRQMLSDVAEGTLADARKFSPMNPGRAADRAIITPCTLHPIPPTSLPFMKHRRIIKTLELPYGSFYVDRNDKARTTARRRSQPLPEPDWDFDKSLIGASLSSGNGECDAPALEPLCVQLSVMPEGTDAYRLLATNCYFFSRTCFRALDKAYNDQWEAREGSLVSEWERDPVRWWKLSPVSTLRTEVGERLSPLQRSALWLNDKLSGESEVGTLMKKTAADMADGMVHVRNSTELLGYGAFFEDDDA